jgi:hypothetical protein
MARDVNDVVVLGFGPWSDVNGLPTLGYGLAAAATVQQLTVVQCDSYAAGPIAADNYAATPIAGDDG